MTEEACN